jgi:hypothetical protein
VISAFAAGFDIAALVLAAVLAAALIRHDRVIGTGFRLAVTRVRMVAFGATVFAVVNAAAVVEMLLALRYGVAGLAAPPSVLAHGATAAIVGGALAWRHARRGAERAFDAQLVRLARG